MNRNLLQKGNAAHIQDVLTKHGISGYDEDLGVFYRVNSLGALEPLVFIIIGLDANKPSGNSDNNGSWFYATDTQKMYAVQNGSRIEIRLGTFSGTLGISQGGTGATTSSGARNNFGLQSGAITEITTSDDAPTQADYVEGRIWVEY